MRANVVEGGFKEADIRLEAALTSLSFIKAGGIGVADIEAAQALLAFREAGKPASHRENARNSSFSASTDIRLRVSADRLHRAVASREHSGFSSSTSIAATAALYECARVANLEYDPDGTLFAQIPIYDSDETITGGAIGIPMHNLVHAIIDDPPVPGIEDTNDNSVYNDTRRITINMNKRSLESDITEETSQCMQGLKQPMQTTAPTKSTAPKQGKGQEPKIRKRAIDLDKEREAPKRARPGEEIDAGAAKFLDGWMKKADGEFEKAMGFAAAAREQLSRRPWPSLEEGSAFIENMKKGTLDPQEVQRRMQEEEEEEEERRQRRRSRRTIRIRCLKGSKRSTATSTAASTVRSKPQKLAFKQEAAAEQMVYKPGLRHLERLPTLQEEEEQLTTRINISETSKSRSAARGNPLTSSNTLQNAKVLIAPANTASATSSQSRTLDPPSATSGRRTRTMAADDLESNLGEKWKIHVTSNGRRPCVKSQHESKSRHDGQPPNQDSSYIL